MSGLRRLAVLLASMAVTAAAAVVPTVSAGAGLADLPWQGTLAVTNASGNTAPPGSFGGTFTLLPRTDAPGDGIYAASLTYFIDYTTEQACPDCLPEPCTITSHHFGGGTVPGVVDFDYGTLPPDGPPALIGFQPTGSTSVQELVHATGCGTDETGPTGGLAFAEVHVPPTTATGTEVLGSLPDFDGVGYFTAVADLHRGPVAENPTCFGRTATIVGTPAAETITGTNGPDVIVGGEGDDTINARGGDDWVCDASGVGNVNVLRGGAGNDHLQGAARLIGNGGNDVLVVAGSVGSTVFLDGGPGNDTLRAPVLKALFTPGPGRDTIVGNAVPNDAVTYAGSTHGVVVDLSRGVATGQGTDRLRQVEGVTGSGHDDVLRGSGASNALTGLGGRDVLTGLGGQDFLAGGAGADRMDGGAGQDYCDGTRVDRRRSCEHRL
jgi:Ca2+-binding RTX toxin-like protein